MTTASSHVLLRQHSAARFSQLSAEAPVLIRVRKGTKVIRHSQGTVTLKSGALGALPAHVPVTIENHPPEGGAYQASVLAPDPALLAEAPLGDPLCATQDDRALAAFERATGALEDPLLPPALRAHAVREVLLWLAHVGVGFGPKRPLTFADRVRQTLATAADAPWRAADLSQALAVSEATLRRRLCAEGTSFSDLLADIRMTRALGLLQTTDLAINQVALEVGYASPSRFTARFQARFGILPSAIRAAVPAAAALTD